MSSQTKMFAIIGAVLIAGALGFYFYSSKPPAQQATERGYHPH